MVNMNVLINSQLLHCNSENKNTDDIYRVVLLLVRINTNET